MRPLLLTLLAACQTTATFELPFEARVGDAPFACGTSYTLGADATTGEFLDARFYVHDVTFLDADGEPLATTLDRNDHQRDGIALLDFEDNTAGCETGSGDTYTTLVGTVEDANRATAVRFTVGLPPEVNHLDAATAAAPLDEPGMFWSWMGGYKYLKVDVATEVKDAFFFHLGATDCEGTPAAGFSCAWGNLAEITVDGVDAASGAVVIDLAALFADATIDAPNVEGDATPGCMSFPGDPQCPAMYASLGLGFEDAPTPASQAAFSAGAR